MEFPLYQVCAAKVSNLTGLPLEQTGRLVALGFLYLTLPACLGLMGVFGVPRHRRWLFPSVVLLSPAYLYYSRTFMIESTALCASMWFLFAYGRSLQSGSWRWIVASAATGAAAGTVKVTTFIVFLIAAAAFTLWEVFQTWRKPDFRPLRLVTRALAATVLPVVAAIAWVRYSDTVKSANPLSATLMSSKLAEFNFGTLAQRMSGNFWSTLLDHLSLAIMSVPNLSVLVLFGLILGSGYRARSLILLVGFISGPLLFANLYFVHDYYFYANGTLLLAVLVLAWSQLLDLEVFSMTAKWAVIALSFGLQLASFLPSYFPAQLRPIEEPPELGSILAAATQPHDVLLVFGQDWDARLPYTAHRRAVMIVDNRGDDLAAVNQVIDRLPSGSITALVVSGKLRKYQAHFTALIERLNLQPQAFLLNDDTMVFLAESRTTAAMEALKNMPPKTFKLSAPVIKGDSGIPRVRYFAANLDSALLSMMSPHPVEVIHPFAPVINEVEKQPVFNAHSPTDIIFSISPTATTATADFGILTGAYEGKNHTDGVEFRVELVSSDGVHQKLYSTFLNPGPREIDRGTKHLQVTLPPGATGQLWFRTLPGPTGSIACGWAYWSQIQIR